MISKTKLAFNYVRALIALIIGMPSALFWGIGAVAIFVPSVEKPEGYAVTCLSMLTISILLICFGVMRLHLLRMCKKYCDVFSSQTVTDVCHLARILDHNEDKTRTRLKKIINRSYIIGIYLDYSTDKIIFVDSGKGAGFTRIAVQCKACGGTNMVPKGKSVKCKYCGSAVSG